MFRLSRQSVSWGVARKTASEPLPYSFTRRFSRWSPNRMPGTGQLMLCCKNGQLCDNIILRMAADFVPNKLECLSTCTLTICVLQKYQVLFSPSIDKEIIQLYKLRNFYQSMNGLHKPEELTFTANSHHHVLQVVLIKHITSTTNSCNFL